MTILPQCNQTHPLQELDRFLRQLFQKTFWGIVCLIVLFGVGLVSVNAVQPLREPDLWQVYQHSLKKAKYVDLTHAIAPSIPVWSGFGSSKFAPAINPKTGSPYTYQKDGFEATHYDLSTDQLGTQVDPPAHWNPDYPAIDELPATFAVRPLVVIPIQDKVAKDPNYHLSVKDIQDWERKHGRIPQGSVVFVRSDWSSSWPDPELAVATCNTNRSNLQSRYFQTRIKCNYNCVSARIKCN